MEHWRAPSPRGPAYQYASHDHMDRFVRQIAAVGFTGLDVFDFSLPKIITMYGSLPAYEDFLRERGVEKITSIFHAARYTPTVGPHAPETHDGYYQRCEALMRSVADIDVENIIVMPLGAYPHVEPVDDEKIKRTADMWNRIGEMTLRYGSRLSTHHEFWGGIRSLEEIEKFYAWTDPRYVYFFCDAGQHVIAGVDPVELYERYHDRTSGFHFKDTHNVDVLGEYRGSLDAELNASVKRWFWEMGTPEGLVDFTALFDAMNAHGFDGWIGVEHDKANIDGGSYAESTAVAMWYVGRELDGIEPPTTPRSPVCWGYSVNQWNSEHDGFTRREAHERAFMTIAASGFTAIELTAGSGRWEPLGRRELIEANYGSVQEFSTTLSEVGIDRVASYFYDPAIPFQEEDSRPRSVLERGDHDAIVESTRGFVELLAELGGSRLVVRPIGSAWAIGEPSPEQWKTAAEVWNRVGSMASGLGVQVSLHVDALSAACTRSGIARLLDLTDPSTVGLTIDTAELMLAQLNPLDIYDEHHSRVNHFHFKQVTVVDRDGERAQPHAEFSFLSAGGMRRIDRWFHELVTPGGLVDFEQVLQRQALHGYSGAIIVESDQSPDPAGSTMANGWAVQRWSRAIAATTSSLDREATQRR